MFFCKNNGRWAVGASRIDFKHHNRDGGWREFIYFRDAYHEWDLFLLRLDSVGLFESVGRFHFSGKFNYLRLVVNRYSMDIQFRFLFMLGRIHHLQIKITLCVVDCRDRRQGWITAHSSFLNQRTIYITIDGIHWTLYFDTIRAVVQ